MTTDFLPTDLTGLILIAKTGVEWRWVRYATTAQGAPLNTWQAPCRHCGEPFEVTGPTVSAALRRAFLRERARRWREIDALPDPADRRQARASLTIKIPVPAGKRISCFELRNCKLHRFSLRDLVAEALV